MVPWVKRYLEGSEGASKEKAYIARNMSHISQDKAYIARHTVINSTNTAFWTFAIEPEKNLEASS